MPLPAPREGTPKPALGGDTMGSPEVSPCDEEDAEMANFFEVAVCNE